MKMVNHVKEWLGPYLDGELRGLRLRQVESHLAECAACRSEMESLRRLSTLLRETPAAVDFTPTERFVANLNLRLSARSIPQPHREGSASSLPRRFPGVMPRKGPSLAWWLVPVGLIGLWFFVQTMITLSSGISTVVQAGWLEKGTAWLTTGTEHTGWYMAAMQLSGDRMAASVQSTLAVLDQVSLFGENLLSQLLWQAVVVLLYWIWLTAWWLRTRGRAQLAKAVRI